jgi:hypothetical protein
LICLFIDVNQSIILINKIKSLLNTLRRIFMRLLISLIALLSIQLSATDDASTCKGCHPIIYNEFQQSFHKKSSIKDDKVHAAVWDKHPAKAKGKYKCAKCHTPNNSSHEGMTCVTCHTITGIESHPKANKNIYETKPKTLYSAEKGMEDKKIVYQEKSSWFGLVKETTGSPYHDIDYTNENYYTGKVCMGCHSHKKNAHDFDVCKTDIAGSENKESNCITCHMPKVSGSSTSIRQSKTHAFHGFAGARNNPEMLSKHVNIDFKQESEGFSITVENKAPHNLLTHPLRVVQLKTTLKRHGEAKALKTETFIKAIGTDNKPSMPWLATQVVKDNMLKANEKRVVTFKEEIKSGDEIETILGFYIVNPKAAPKLDLEKEKELTSFTVLKHSYFKVP